MIDLSRDQRRRAQELVDAGLKRHDAAALVSFWDAMPPGQRWALVTEQEREEIRAQDPELAAALDQLAESYQ